MWRSKENMLMEEERKFTKEIEALLLLENGTIKQAKMVNILGISVEEINKYIKELNFLYKKIGSVMIIDFIEDFYYLTINRRFDSLILANYKQKKKKLSKAVLETLAIIAYKQPITRVEIEGIRGVSSSNYVKILLEEEMIEIVGKKETVGRPIIFKTSTKFLQQFGLKKLSDLPPFEEIKTYPFLDEE